MKKTYVVSLLKDLWTSIPQDNLKPRAVLYLCCLGFFVGFLTGSIIAVFRITTDFAYARVLDWTSHSHSTGSILAWFGLAALAALVTGFLVRNPAIRFGGHAWVEDALAHGQPKAWLRILLPKFIGSWLVMACGISVGREGPSIQMGVATALGLKNTDSKNAIERRFFILAGSAAGLAAAFSAPFAGICYVYEILKEKISRTLLIFLLAGSFGVYVSATLIFGLDVMLPLGPTPLPDLWKLWILVPLAVFSAAVGIAYNYLIRLSMTIYGSQKKVPVYLRPLFPFLAAALMVLIFPAITGEGLSIFPVIQGGHTLIIYLIFFILAKLFFTAFCYGSGIPAGLMVPVLCVGGVMGGIYSEWLMALGLADNAFFPTCIVLGMCGAFTAAERAPLTGMMLVVQMTGAYAATLGLLLVGAIAAFCSRLCNVKSV